MRMIIRAVELTMLAFLAAACGQPEEAAQEGAPARGVEPLDTDGDSRRIFPDPCSKTITGEATFYARRFEGRRTASGIPFRQIQMVAAHRAYPFGTLLRVTNLRNDRQVTVRVIDRGLHGWVALARRTMLDLSERKLGYIQQERAPIKVDVLEWGRGIAA